MSPITRLAMKYAGNSGYAGLASAALRGAGYGAALGGVTGAIDRDRSMLPGAIGGAFWGALGGMGGRYGTQRALRASRIPIAAKAGYRKTSWARGLRSGAYGAAGLTGLYGAGNFLMGSTNRRKHYTRFHHGETSY